MIDNPNEIDPNSVGAILYRPRDDVDRLLADFAQDLAQQGVRIGGIVQQHSRRANGTHVMLAIDVATGQEISISQPLGSGAMSCNLDTNGLAEAAAVVSQALCNKIDLLVISKFAKQEAAGRGLRAEFVDAITRGVPVLTAVPKKCLADWRTFTAGVGTLLPCDRQFLKKWWFDISTRVARSGAFSPSCGYLGTTIPDRLMTTVRLSSTSAPKSPIRLLRRLRKQP
ncbi:nucleoside-triphosphatase THEP1 [Bradyrhizobium sp. USDA 4354]